MNFVTNKYDKKSKFVLLTLLFLKLLFTSALASEQLIIEPDAGRAPLINAIKSAKTSINLVIYGFTDRQLLDALISANQSGKTVRVLIEPHPYKADDENQFAIKQFQNAHVALQWANPDFKLTHQKTFTLDNNRAIVMTFNLTRSTFKNERNFALIIDDPALVAEINKVFTADWRRDEVTTENPALIWSPKESQTKILDFIASAKQSLDIYAQDLTDYKMIGALAKAARSGKKVKVLLSHERRAHPNKKLDYLQRAGVEIHHSQGLIIHAKVIIADESRAILGSTNFTYPSMQQNRELSLVTQDPQVVKQLVQTFQHDF